MARAEAFDLIITSAATTCVEDILMLRKLRMIRPHTRMIILTKEKMPGDILRAIQNHAFSYFTLPIALEDLRDLIEHVLQQPAWDDGIELIQREPRVCGAGSAMRFGDVGPADAVHARECVASGS